MGFRPRLDPRVVDRGGGVRSNFRDKLVRALTKATIGTKRDGLKTDVELLVSDDGVGAIVLGLTQSSKKGSGGREKNLSKGPPSALCELCEARPLQESSPRQLNSKGVDS